jgi:hypothetical protein
MFRALRSHRHGLPRTRPPPAPPNNPPSMPTILCPLGSIEPPEFDRLFSYVRFQGIPPQRQPPQLVSAIPPRGSFDTLSPGSLGLWSRLRVQWSICAAFTAYFRPISSKRNPGLPRLHHCPLLIVAPPASSTTTRLAGSHCAVHVSLLTYMTCLYYF